jgi:hypothetical protein
MQDNFSWWSDRLGTIHIPDAHRRFRGTKSLKKSHVGELPIEDFAMSAKAGESEVSDLWIHFANPLAVECIKSYLTVYFIAERGFETIDSNRSLRFVKKFGQET